jgi:hypothetical protein
MLSIPFFLLGSILVVQSTELSNEFIPLLLNGYFIGGMLLVLTPLIVIVTLSVSLKRAGRKTDKLINNGLIGVARFISVYETTRMTGDGPVIRLELEITTENHDPYRIIYLENPNLIKHAFLYPDNRFRVMVDPDEKGNILINWTPLCLLNPGQEQAEIIDSRRMISSAPDMEVVSEGIPSLSI